MSISEGVREGVSFLIPGSRHMSLVHEGESGVIQKGWKEEERGENKTRASAREVRNGLGELLYMTNEGGGVKSSGVGVRGRRTHQNRALRIFGCAG